MSEFQTQAGERQEGLATLAEMISPLEKQKLRRTALIAQKNANLWQRFEWQVGRRPTFSVGLALVAGTVAGLVLFRTRRA